MRRYGQALLWVGGLAIASLMAYVVALDAGLGRRHGSASRGRDVTEVAVFYPERILWQEFQQGVKLCVRKGMAALVEESDTSIVVSTPRFHRLIRFELHDARGLRETKDEVRRVIDRSPAPLAVVGSSNTVLTRAMAEALRASTGVEWSTRPVLLVPWASAVLVDRPERGEGPEALLDLFPGRTFRFCPNNQHQADLIVSCLTARTADPPPRRAILVVDRRDPYSVDLAACFHRAVEAAAPDAEIVERADSLSVPILFDPAMRPNLAEEALADSIWRDAESLPAGGTTWVVLPLQSEPTQRLITALRRHPRRLLRTDESPLRVVCGDGIGFSVLADLAGRCTFPIWCGSSGSVPAAAKALVQGISPDTQIPAEIVSALILCLDLPDDRPASANQLRDNLAALHLDARSAAALGRSLAFSRSGERLGDDLGHVLMIRSDQPTVFAISRAANGRWNDPVPLERSHVVDRPSP